MSLINLAFGFFVLPESHPPEKRRSIDWLRTNPLNSLLAIRRYPILLSLAGTLFLDRIAHDSLPGTWVLYTTYRFGWKEWENGLALALVGIMFGVVQGLFTGPIVKRLGERWAMLFGLGMSVVTFVLYGSATQGWMMYLFIVIGSVGAAGEAAMMSLITKNTPDDEQGAVQGTIGSVHGIAAIAGPLLATELFGYFTSPQAPFQLPGAAFYAAAVFAMLAVGLGVRATRGS